jgi:hypothetical protein
LSSDSTDIGIQYQERLIDGRIHFVPKIEKIEKLNALYGHKEIDAKGHLVLGVDSSLLKIGDENDFVKINSEKISILFK